jgi:transcriptional regulator
MSKIKQERNAKMLELKRQGLSVYKIAKRFKLTWPRAKRILVEQEAREAVK